MCEPGKPCPGAEDDTIGTAAANAVMAVVESEALRTWERLRAEPPERRLRPLSGMQTLNANPHRGAPLMGACADLILNAIIQSDFDIEKVPGLITEYVKRVVRVES